MRKIGGDIGDIKNMVLGMRGSDLDIMVNPGRNKISEYSGSIGEIYPSLFTLRLTEATGERKITCSYSDVMCGKVSLKFSASTI